MAVEAARPSSDRNLTNEPAPVILEGGVAKYGGMLTKMSKSQSLSALLLPSTKIFERVEHGLFAVFIRDVLESILEYGFHPIRQGEDPILDAYME